MLWLELPEMPEKTPYKACFRTAFKTITRVAYWANARHE